jgi:hypothetical protein
VEHFASSGLNMHLGTHGTGKKSKTECLFCPSTRERPLTTTRQWRVVQHTA